MDIIENNEAKKENINAFCLTVDKSGHDYLKTMCEDIGYEVLDMRYKLVVKQVDISSNCAIKLSNRFDEPVSRRTVW